MDRSIDKYPNFRLFDSGTKLILNEQKRNLFCWFHQWLRRRVVVLTLHQMGREGGLNLLYCYR